MQDARKKISRAFGARAPGKGLKKGLKKGLEKASRVSSSTMTPRSMNNTRSATRFAKPISCVTHSMVIPSCASVPVQLDHRGSFLELGFLMNAFDFAS